MPFPDHVFAHTPNLRGLIRPPDQSEMRFGLERFDELDEQAKEEGWPDGWRMDHAERELNRQKILSGRMEQDLWVFAYGSLIWDPAVYVEEYRFGTLPGWRRSFCMLLTGGRGTHETPGLMAALDQGDQCHGVVIRIAAQMVDQETRFMWNREMFAGAYNPLFLPVETPQGPVEALAFVMNHANFRYRPDIPQDQAARMIAEAEGTLGPNFEYLDNLVRHLEELGIEDAEMRGLYRMAKAHRDGARF